MRAIDYFDKGADAFPKRAAFIDRGISYSYREAKELTERIARALAAGGLRPEERVAIYSPNDTRVLLCWLGLLRAGGV
jgi:acyl-CoA synthetase (AMP-forming)/AMP-acid ligase II